MQERHERETAAVEARIRFEEHLAQAYTTQRTQQIENARLVILKKQLIQVPRHTLIHPPCTQSEKHTHQRGGPITKAVRVVALLCLGCNLVCISMCVASKETT